MASLIQYFTNGKDFTQSQGYGQTDFAKKVNYYKNHFHDGVDYAVKFGTPLTTPAQAKVTYAGLKGGYGGTVMLDFGNGQKVMLGHMSNIKVKPGDTVPAGTVIGYSGGAKGTWGAGNSTGAHTHITYYQDGKNVNPMQYAAKQSGTNFSQAEQPSTNTSSSTSQKTYQQPLIYNQANSDPTKLVDMIFGDLGKKEEEALSETVDTSQAQMNIPDFARPQQSMDNQQQDVNMPQAPTAMVNPLQDYLSRLNNPNKEIKWL